MLGYEIFDPEIGFNPRPCVRGDLYHSGRSRGFPQFQSTPLREGRQEIQVCVHPLACFNPRPCVRGDKEHELSTESLQVSIHAPA